MLPSSWRSGITTPTLRAPEKLIVAVAPAVVVGFTNPP